MTVIDVRKDTERLANILIKANLIDELQLRSAMAKIGNWGGRLPRVLSELGFAEEDAMTEAIPKARMGRSRRSSACGLITALRDGARRPCCSGEAGRIGRSCLSGRPRVGPWTGWWPSRFRRFRIRSRG